MDFLQPNYIEIESLMSQEVFENFEIHNDVFRSWCDSHSRQYRTTQTIDTCFMMYLSLNFKYQISHRCFIAWRVKFRTLHLSDSVNCSIACLTIRFYVISEINRSSDLDSFVSAVFASMYDLVLQNLRHWRSLLGSFRQYHVERACSEASDNVSLRKSHRWESHIAEEVRSGEIPELIAGKTWTKAPDWAR